MATDIKRPMTAAEARLERNRAHSHKYWLGHKNEIRERKRKWREGHRELQREKDRKYRESHGDYIREMSRTCSATYRKKHPEKAKEVLREYRKRNPEKIYARYQAKNKIPHKDRCELCGVKAMDRHHPDYSKPLEVMNLCHLCHCSIHKAVKAVVKERSMK